MAAPAVLAADKAAAFVVSDERSRKALGVLIAAVLTPFIIVIILSLLSGTTDHNNGSYQAQLQEAQKYIGYPYVWGGSSPSTSFDCSGYICWVYSQSGVYNLPRTNAQGIFNQCAVISRSEAAIWFSLPEPMPRRQL